MIKVFICHRRDLLNTAEASIQLYEATIKKKRGYLGKCTLSVLKYFTS